MRIIGGHDYYDTAQAFGHDPKIVFVRKADTLPKDTFNRPHAEVYFVAPEKVKNHFYRHRARFLKTKTGTWLPAVKRVIFCGKMYTGLEMSFHPDASHLTEKKDTQVFWNKEDFEKWVATITDKLVPLVEDVIGWRSYENFLFRVKDLSISEYKFVIDNRISIAIYLSSEGKWGIDCAGLQDLQFYRVFSATDAFQELDMWMSGALGLPGAPMVEISDSDRMAKHGMDKWSFRKKVR
jgi:hypothetical protein